MKKWLLITTLLGSVVLTGCWYNMNIECDCMDNLDGDAVLNEYTQYCLDNGWTYSLIHSQTDVYWECAFPSWITCGDDILWTDECNFEPNLENIDTQEKRIAGCEQNAKEWVIDFIDDAEYIWVEWSDNIDESTDTDWNVDLITRQFNLRYSKDWKEWILPWECEANFQDWSLWTSYWEEYEAE